MPARMRCGLAGQALGFLVVAIDQRDSSVFWRDSDTIRIDVEGGQQDDDQRRQHEQQMDGALVVERAGREIGPQH